MVCKPRGQAQPWTPNIGPKDNTSTIPSTIHHPLLPDGAGTHEALLKGAARLVIGLPHGGLAAMDLDPTLIQFWSTHFYPTPLPSIDGTVV